MEARKLSRFESAEHRRLAKLAFDAYVRRTQGVRMRSVNRFDGYCVQCGTEHENWTVGCPTCGDRARKLCKRGHYPGGEAAYQAQASLVREDANRRISESSSRWWTERRLALYKGAGS